jgi:hypothetical protein
MYANIQEERAAAIAAMADKRAADRADAQARPFNFADLNGRPEPESWGPKYSKPVKTARVSADRFPTNCASGQKFDFDAAKHRAKIRAEFSATAGRERREWALGKQKNERGETIGQAYKRVMREKRARELAELGDMREAA